MEPLPKPSTMTDQELLREWYWVNCDADNGQHRTAVLAAEMGKRGIVF